MSVGSCDNVTDLSTNGNANNGNQIAPKKSHQKRRHVSFFPSSLQMFEVS